MDCRVETGDSPVPRLLVSAIHASDPDLPQHHRDESIRVLDVQMRLLAKSQGVVYDPIILSNIEEQLIPAFELSCSLRSSFIDA
jgi:hypothetical protein